MSHHDETKIYRPGETLPVSIELLKLAEVTRKDALKAVEQWEDSPPAKQYADILGASSDA